MKAVVIGAGWSGALAAAALKPFFEKITVLERDALGLTRLQRSLAQKKQLHNLLTGGLLSAESLLPGFRQSITLAGGIVGSVSSDTHVFESNRWMPRRELGLSIVSAPRLLFEQTAWRLLNDLGGVTALGEIRVTELMIRSDYVAGVIGIDAAGRKQQWSADLVVDASGGGFKRPLQLRTPLTTVRVNRWYASFEIAKPKEFRGSPEFWLVFPSAGTRGTLISPLGDNDWIVSLSGNLPGDPLPRSGAQVLSYVEQLDDPTRSVPKLLDQAFQERAVAPADLQLETYRQPLATWHRYDLWDGAISGYFPLGDAIARQAPLIGQGLSVAARQAVALRSASQIWCAAGDRATRRTAEAQYLHAASNAAWQSWSLQLALEPPGLTIAGEPCRPSPLTLSDLQALASRVDNDSVLHAAYVGLWHLTTPPNILVDYHR